MNNIQHIQHIQSIHFHIHRCDEIINLLKQLTHAPDITECVFHNILYSLKNNHHIYLYLKNNKVVGMVTLIVEQKLIHGGKLVGHIEDLVVDKNYNGQGIATELLTYAIQIAKDTNCYKIILNCDKRMVAFYEKSGFTSEEVQMKQYLNKDNSGI